MSSSSDNTAYPEAKGQFEKTATEKPRTEKRGRGAGKQWTKEKVQQLEALWDQELSAAEIAEEMGGGLTKSAVIGKAHRLGLPPRRESPGTGTKPAKPRKPRVARKTPSVRAPVSSSPIPDQQKEEPPHPTKSNVTLLRLKEESCRWVVGNPKGVKTIFCGAATPEKGVPYCLEHDEIAYNRTPPGQYKRGLADKAFSRWVK